MKSYAKKNDLTGKKHTTYLFQSNSQKKQKFHSQKTLDTCANQQWQQMKFQDILRDKHEQQLLKQIKLTLQTINKHAKLFQINKDRPKQIDIQVIRSKQLEIQSKDKQLEQLNRQIQNLKQVYQRDKPAFKPKVKIQANRYFQDHIKVFTLADQISKQRKHLELHLEHHQKIKYEAQSMHIQVKQILPHYYYFQKARELKPISYGDFKAKALLLKRQKQRKQRQRQRLRSRSSSRSISSRNSVRSNTSRASVKDIIQGNVPLSASKGEKSLWQIQRQKAIVEKARTTKLKRHEAQIKSLQEKLSYVKEEDKLADQKLEELELEIERLKKTTEKSFSQFFMTFEMTQSKKE